MLDFAELVRRRLAETRTSKHRAAVGHGLPQDAIRSVLNGHSPRLERLEQICDALDLELYVGPPRDAEPSDVDAGRIQIRADKQTRNASLTRFNADVQLPVRTWKECSPEGFLKTPDESKRAPAPEGLDDPQAFYTNAFNHDSMVPAGVWSGDHCLVSPGARLRADRLIWLRHQADHEAIRLPIRITADAYEVLAWGKPDENGRQEMMTEIWKRQDVVDRGMLLAIYRGTPSSRDPPSRIPNWRSDRVADIWWNARKAAGQTGEASHTALDAHVRELLDLLELEAETFRNTTRKWFERGTVSVHELWELLQEVEKVKQSAYLITLTMRPSEPAREP
ncbi:MAG: hypothetical protein F4Y14_09935 [Acidobacteria bacterium]|nr:hypothetical protein [Acidobacteriota bacterium]